MFDHHCSLTYLVIIAHVYLNLAQRFSSDIGSDGQEFKKSFDAGKFLSHLKALLKFKRPSKFLDD